VNLDVDCQFTIRAQIPLINPEGYIRFRLAFALVSLILFWLWTPLGWIGTLVTIWCVCAFFPRSGEGDAGGRAASLWHGRRAASRWLTQVAAAAELGLGDNRCRESHL